MKETPCAPKQGADWLSCWHYLANRLSQTIESQSRSHPLPAYSSASDGHSSSAPAGLPAFAQRLSDFTGAALARELLGPESQLGKEEVSQSRLLNRYHHQRQKDCLALINAAGLDAVAIKGFALAQQIYRDPDLRITGDLDLVIRPDDLPAFLTLFRAENYEFRPLPAKPWGFISEASFQPLASPDGVVNLDLHIAPDCFPAYRALTTERLFGQAVPYEKDLPHIKLASLSHGFFLLASNAAKDKFGPFAVKKILDGITILQNQPSCLDQQEIEYLTINGKLDQPMQVFLALLDRLSGKPTNPGFTGAKLEEFTGLTAAWTNLFSDENHDFPSGLWPQLRREFLLCTAPSVFVANNLKRLKGLVRPGSGLPLESKQRPQAR